MSGGDRLRQAALRLYAERGTTQLTVSELAEAAGVSRGTVYNNLDDVEALFQQIATDLGVEMHERADRTLEGVDDPAYRLAQGIKLYIRRAHEERVWGQFMLRFAISEPSLQTLWRGTPARALRAGAESGRFSISTDQVMSTLALTAGGTLTAMMLVQQGHMTWRAVSADMVALLLRGLGLSPEEAAQIATIEPPELAPMPQTTGRAEAR